MVNNQSYIDYIPSADRIYNARHAASVPTMKSKHTFFKKSYIPSTIIEWNKLDQDIGNEKAVLYLENTYYTLLDMQQIASIFNVSNATGIKLLIRL